MAFLHESNLKNPEFNIDAIDQLIANLIDETDSEEFEGKLGNSDEWQVFYHLSSMRRGLYAWYGFRANATVLEIGAGFGALTGLLCDKCSKVVAVENNSFRAQYLEKRYKHRENLDIYSGNIMDVLNEILEENKSGFDYIILTGILEKLYLGKDETDLYIKYLTDLSKVLKQAGCILIAADNRYGIRYFCGSPEMHTKVPFEGINHYPHSADGYSFTRHELYEIVNKCGLKTKFYYPLPDYILPQIIYSDEYMKGTAISERLVPYYPFKTKLLAYEKDIYKDIIENQALPFLSNSFLVECCTSGVFDQTIFATLSTDRGRKHGFATIIKSDCTVEKKCLYSEGKGSLLLACKNIDALRNHGINVVDHVITNDAIRMPFIKEPSLSNQIQGCMPYDVERLVFLFDLLYDNILRSSDHVVADENSMMKKYNSSLDFGPILKEAQIDMVPINCFYVNGTLLFFDQEFTKEKCPAGYVMFRAIKYTYMYMPKLYIMYNIDLLKNRYQLENVWDIYELEEKEFIDGNRNTHIYGQFYRWSEVDRSDIYKRIIEMKECNYD